MNLNQFKLLPKDKKLEVVEKKVGRTKDTRFKDFTI